MKNSSDTIGNRTHDLLACSTVPQPTAPLRTPQKKKIVSINFSCLVFFLLDFLTLENGTNRLSQNVGKELPLSAM
jgi:hypothetical protein